MKSAAMEFHDAERLRSFGFLAAAVAVHAMIAAASSFTAGGVEISKPAALAPAIEITLEDLVRAANAAPPAEALPETSVPPPASALSGRENGAPDRRLQGPESLAPALGTELDEETPMPAALDVAQQPPPSAPAPRNIDLWAYKLPPGGERLNRRGAEVQRPGSDMGPQSVGLLSEGLAERDAKLGLAKSSAAVNSGYQAAQRFAPGSGSAVFEVRADAQGRVQSVVLVSAPTDEASWRRVADYLGQLLTKRRLRVSSGSQGLVTRLRIERGSLAEGPPAQRKTKRGVANPRPENDRVQWSESTQATLDEPARMSPSISTNVLAGESLPTKVIVLSEREL